MTELINLIPSLGFPIVCVIALGWFAVYMVRHMAETNAKNMADVQGRCKEREDKLYNELAESRKINSKFADIIAKYGNSIEEVKKDVSSMKEDIIEIKAKLGG